MLPAVEGAPRHSNGFKTVAATLHESAQNGLIELDSVCGEKCCVWPSSRWHIANSDGSIQRRMCLRNTCCAESQTGQARKREGAQPEHSNNLDSIPSNSAARLSTSSLFQVERQSCMQQDVRQQEGCSPAVGQGWNETETVSAHGQHGEPSRAQPNWFRSSTTPGREVALDSGSRASWAKFVSHTATKHHDEEGLKVFSLDGHRRPDSRGECGARITAN